MWYIRQLWLPWKQTLSVKHLKAKMCDWKIDYFKKYYNIYQLYQRLSKLRRPKAKELYFYTFAFWTELNVLKATIPFGHEEISTKQMVCFASHSPPNSKYLWGDQVIQNTAASPSDGVRFWVWSTSNIQTQPTTHSLELWVYCKVIIWHLLAHSHNTLYLTKGDDYDVKHMFFIYFIYLLIQSSRNVKFVKRSYKMKT